MSLFTRRHARLNPDPPAFPAIGEALTSRPEERARLAASDSAPARLKTLDLARQMQVAGMFMRVRDQHRR